MISVTTRDIFSFYYLSLFRLFIFKSKKSPTSHFFCSGVINDDSSFYDKLFQAIRMIKSFKTPLFSGVFHLPTWLISPPSTLSVVHGPPGSRYLDHHHNHEDIYIMMERLSVTFLLVLPSPANFFWRNYVFIYFYFFFIFVVIF